MSPYISPDDLYFFFTTVKTGDLGYNPYWVDAQVVYNLITDVPYYGKSGRPATFQLLQNYPNPFNPTTKISFQIPELGFVSLKVFDVLGNNIMTLVNEEKPAGKYEFNFNSSGIPSGIYFYQLVAGQYSETRKMCFIR